jgi:NADPH-dependent glutamate synthase beta subunit-like oxidoreductase
MPIVDKKTMQATRPGVFFGGDAAWGPENIIWAVEHGTRRRSRSTTTATACRSPTGRARR